MCATRHGARSRRTRERAFEAYERMLEQGVAKEVARAVLPLSTYTKYYWSCNPRSLMHFCGLRNHENAQYEIQQYAAAAETLPRAADADHARRVHRERPHRPLTRMERVVGIGGVFLRSAEPEALRAWYETHLGISISEWGGNVFVAEAGDATVWSIFPGETEYWPAEQQTMVNYRVRDLDAVLAQLRAAGAEVDERVEEQEFGRFGWAVDPDGNRFELWEPA